MHCSQVVTSELMAT